jgi:hypothetical protein
MAQAAEEMRVAPCGVGKYLAQIAIVVAILRQVNSAKLFRSSKPGVAGLQQFGRRIQVPHAGEPVLLKWKL